jgi:peroxiredoxin
MPGETLRHRLMRYAIVAAIIAVVGGIFIQREYLDADEQGGVSPLASPLAIGEPAPDFTLDLVDGTPFRLSDQRGKVVVLNCWASWCAPCRFEMPEFQALYEEREGGGDFLIVAVNAAYDDPRGSAERFIEEFGLTFPTPFDTTRDVANQYGVRGLPATFFIDRDGILRSRSYGPVFGDQLLERVAAAGG